MRLICPNCSAQYEIDVTLIPDEGRDVQCSNCGHTWFELPPAGEAAGLEESPDAAPEPQDYDAPEPEAQPEDEILEAEAQSNATRAIAAATEDVSDQTESERAESEPFKDTDDPFAAAASEFLPTAKPTDSAAQDDTPQEEASDDGDPDASAPDDTYDDPEDDAPDIDLSAIAPTTVKARRPADAADVDLLRDEANRELSQRRAPPPASEALESQTDLGLDDLPSRATPSRALRARMARSSGNDNTFEDTEPASEADYQEPQRDLLPDIDEINSTLSRDEAADPAKVAANRSGFRLGFGLVVLIGVGAVLAYAFAPNIANAVPGAEGALLRFVDLANQLRDWIDGLVA